MTKVKDSKNKRTDGRPSATAQWINAFVQTEPVCYILHGLRWMVLLGLGGPLLGLATLIGDLGRCLRYFIMGERTCPTNSDTELLAVVITGCDSGFGQALALELAQRPGFVVFCACLNKESLAQYEKLDNCIPLLLDVTNEKAVAQCAKMVSEWLKEDSNKGKPRHLHALVNNAGIGTKPAMIDGCPMKDYQAAMDVNCFGMIRMVQAFLPLLQQQSMDGTYRHARIVNLSSVAGLLRAAGMAVSPYVISKNAAEAFCQTVRLECKHLWNIDVVTVNPSFHETPILDLAQRSDEELFAERWDNMSPTRQALYGKEMIRHAVVNGKKRALAKQWDLGPAVQILLRRAILQQNPPCQLLLGSDAQTVVAPFSLFPPWLQQWVLYRAMKPKSPAAMTRQSKESKEE